MPRFYKQCSSACFLISILFLPSLAVAAYTNPDRDLIIQKQMNCMHKQITDGGETIWENLCSGDRVITENLWETTKRGNTASPPSAERTMPDTAQASPATASQPHRQSQESQILQSKSRDSLAAMHYPVQQEEQDEFSLDEAEANFSFSEKFARENAVGIETPKHQSEIGAEAFYFRYEEPDVMKDIGLMRGVYGFYAYRPNQGNFLYTKAINLCRLEGRYAWGQIDYEADNGAAIDDVDDWATELRGILGKEYIDPSSHTGIMIFSGFGYRYLNDDTSSKTSTVGSTMYYGYQRESNYYYLPLGFEVSNQPHNGWSFMVRGEYDWFIYGLQKSHLSDGNPFISTKNDDIENSQRKGFGLRGSLQIRKALIHANLIFEPFVRYWNIEDSKTVRAFVDGAYGNYIEPHNNTIEAGFKLGVQF